MVRKTVELLRDVEPLTGQTAHEQNARERHEDEHKWGAEQRVYIFHDIKSHIA